MKKAYIILAHKNQAQLMRLIDRLDDGFSSFFVHIDKKSSINKNMAVFNTYKSIVLVPAVETQWGSFGLVEATLNAMGAIRHHVYGFERIILLSGQDYPVKSNEDINNFFKSSAYSVFIDSFLLPNYEKWSADGGLYRITKYFFGFTFFNKYGAKAINFLATFISRFQRTVHYKLMHYYGSQWWTMDMYALNYVLDYVDQNPGYSAFHRFTFAPDELFFQTILLNAKDEKLSKTILNDNKRFMKWLDSSSANPEILISEDFDEIQKSQALFARKFDGQVDGGILEMIDEQILKINPEMENQSPE